MNVERWVNLVSSFAVAALLLSVGLRGLIARRPLVYSTRWFVAAFGAMLLKQLTPLLGSGYSAKLRYVELWSLLAPVLVIAVVLVFWFYWQGYVIVGANGTVLRNALRHILGERGLSYEERPGALHIPSEGLDLKLSFNEWVGTTHIDVAPARGKPLLQELESGLNRFFSSRPVALRKAAFVLYACAGALMLAVAVLYLTLEVLRR